MSASRASFRSLSVACQSAQRPSASFQKLARSINASHGSAKTLIVGFLLIVISSLLRLIPMCMALLEIELPYPSLKSHGTPASNTKSASFKALPRLCRMCRSSRPNSPRAIPERNVGTPNCLIALANTSALRGCSIAPVPMIKTGFSACSSASRILVICDKLAAGNWGKRGGLA